MSEKSKLKIEFAPGVLDEVPEDEREEFLEEIRDLFKDVETDGPPGKPVRAIEPGVTKCPLCNGELSKPFVLAVPEDGTMFGRPGLKFEARKSFFYECEACEETFAHDTQ